MGVFYQEGQAAGYEDLLDNQGNLIRPTELMSRVAEGNLAFDGRVSEACDAWYEAKMSEIDMDVAFMKASDQMVEDYLTGQGFLPGDRLPAYEESVVSHMRGSCSDGDLDSRRLDVYNECGSAQTMFESLPDGLRGGKSSCFGKDVYDALVKNGVFDMQNDATFDEFENPFLGLKNLVSRPGAYDGVARGQYSVLMSDRLRELGAMEHGAERTSGLESYFKQYDYLEDMLNKTNCGAKRVSLGDYGLYKQMQEMGHRGHELSEYSSSMLEGRLTHNMPSEAVEFCELTGRKWDKDMQSKVESYVTCVMKEYQYVSSHDTREMADQVRNEIFEAVYAADRKLQGSDVIASRMGVGRAGVFDNGSRNLALIGSESQKSLDSICYQSFCGAKFDDYLDAMRARHVKSQKGQLADRSVPSQDEICPNKPLGQSEYIFWR